MSRPSFRRTEPEIIAWLDANGIPSRDVPRDAVAVVTGGKITCPVFLRRQGKLYVDPATGDAARGEAVVDMKRKPTPGVSAWLRGEIIP